MIKDLNEISASEETLDCDVLVIGAGIAGTVAAVQLARTGLRVVVLESGGRSQESETHPLNDVVQRGQAYTGATAGRFRCLGGTSTRWGGAMLPFQQEDMGPHTAGWPIDWPVGLDQVLGYLPALEQAFGLPGSSFETPGYVDRSSPHDPSPDFMVRAAKWPPFKLRNVAKVFERELDDAKGPQVWLNATVTDIRLDAGSCARTVTARSDSGRALVVTAREVVVAAGAIESTRLLLQLDAAHDHRLFAPHDVIGRYFHDHLSAAVASIEVTHTRDFNRTVGFRFEGAAMRNTRFELSGAARRAKHLPGAFAHVGVKTDGSSGFDGLRDALRAVQRRRLPALKDMALIVRDLDWFAQAAWARVAHQRVLMPSRAEHELHLVTEQEPQASNRISLEGDRRDSFGLPLAAIDWRVGDTDIAAADAVLDALMQYWRTTSLANLGRIARYPQERWAAGMVEGGGIYHPGGSLRMASSPQVGVVDDQLRTFAVPNVTVLSTAVFPTGGGANPTLMLMLFAMRAVSGIAAAARAS